MPVVASLKGRLGNQLFQYYTAYALARRIKEPLFFDIDRSDSFAIQDVLDVSKAGPSILRKYLGPSGIAGKFYRKVQRVLPVKLRTFVQEPRQEFFAAFAQMQQPCYLDGYWQSYKYFEDLEPADFEPLIASISKIAGDDDFFPDAANSVVIHVRRTDAVGQFPELGDYYYRAIDKFGWDKKFLVVSDDPAYCRDYFRDYTFVRVLPEGRTAFQDLNLLVHASSAIIANSTFSWWGAYLSPAREKREEKMVIAPADWFSRDGGPAPLADVYPATWTIL